MSSKEEVVVSEDHWNRIQAIPYNRPQVVESKPQYQRFKGENKLEKARRKEFRKRMKLEEQAKEEHRNMLAAEEKENKAVIEISGERRRVAEEQERQSEEELRRRHEAALRQEQEKDRQRQLSNTALADHHTEQIRKNKQLREEERQQEREERDRLRGLDELHAQELRHQAGKEAELKKIKLKHHLEEISRTNLCREREAQKLNMEEEKRKRVEFDMNKKLQQRNKCQAEQFRKCQIPKEIVADRLAVTIKEQDASTRLREEVKLSKTVAEQEAKVAKQQQEMEEKAAAMLKSISAHREANMQEKEEHQNNLDWLQNQKESHRLSTAQTRSMKQHLNRKKLDLSYKETDVVEETITCLPFTSDKGKKLVYGEAVSMGLHYILQHFDVPGTYARILFVDFSSMFNTIILTSSAPD
ncbi:hypothetical protein L3Q82_002933 [Scortum barcoo]|uniref:Uncharacterized protein n=1 Tax=Scortum barcoo TaxID=214431 RepID=A0ACB8VUP9_9TELE|nr:hypothetical protein L3Q82_002933 [Scortum barcoo]